MLFTAKDFLIFCATRLVSNGCIRPVMRHSGAPGRYLSDYRRGFRLARGLSEDSCTTVSDELKSVSRIQCITFYDPH